MSDDLSDFTPDTQDMSDFKADAPNTTPSQPGAASRFWAGVKAGTGGDNTGNAPPPDPNRNYLRNPDFANNRLLPGSGVYRDIKAGNYASAVGRVVGPAAELALMVGAGSGRVEAPPERVPLWKQPWVEPEPVPTAVDATPSAPYQPARATRPTAPERTPLWQKAGIEPGAPPSSIEVTTPEDIQAYVQRMASRPKPTPNATPTANPATASPVTEGQSVPIGNLPIAKGNPYAGPHTPPSMEVAQSSNIQLHGYEPNSQTMLVQFKNGRVYEYKGVPQEIYDAYKTDPASQGSFFAQNIKGRYQTSFRGTVKPTAGAKIREALGGS